MNSFAITQNKFMDAFILSVLCTVATYAGLWIIDSLDMAYVTSHIGLLELFSVFTSYACTWLCTVQSRVNYIIGVITTAAYSLLFVLTGAYALAIFNGYLVFTLFYGWIVWGKDEVTKPVTGMKLSFTLNRNIKVWDNWHIYVLIGIVSYFVYTGIFDVVSAYTGTQVELSQIDVTIAVLSVVAQLLLDRKKIITWVVWAVVNIISIPYYWHIGLYMVAIQYCFFLINNLLGYMAWKKTMVANMSNSSANLSVT